MTKTERKKAINKEIQALKPRIKEITKSLYNDRIIDEIADWTGELMGKLETDFIDDTKLEEHAFNKIFDAIAAGLIKQLQNKK